MTIREGSKLFKGKIRIAISLDPIRKKGDWRKFTKSYTVETISYNKLAEHLKEGRAIGFDYTLTKEERKLLKEKKNITTDCNYYRDSDYFKGSEFIAIEFDDNVDNKFTLKEIREGKTDRAKYINENACMVYTSPQNRTENKGDRFHVIFHFLRTIEQRDELKNIHKALQSKFPSSDQGDSLSGAYWGCGENADVVIPGNLLSDKALDELLTSHKPTPKAESLFDKKIVCPHNYSQTIYDKELENLSHATKGERGVILFKVSCRIGEILQPVGLSYNQALDNIVRVAESIGTDKRFTPKRIRDTAKNGLSKGMKNPLYIESAFIDDKYKTEQTPVEVYSGAKRLWQNRPLPNTTQQPKHNMNLIKNETIEILGIDSEEKQVDHIKTVYLLNVDKDSDVKALYILNNISSFDFVKYYMGLWELAKELGSLQFHNLILNDILECMYGDYLKDRNTYYERGKILKVIPALAYINTKVVENGIEKVVPKYLYYEREEGNKKNIKFLELFQRSSPMGSYYPKRIYLLDGNYFRLSYYLYTNINRYCLCSETHKGSGKYLPPDFTKKQLKWDPKYACSIAGLSGTYDANPSKAIKDLEDDKFKMLKDYSFIKNWELIDDKYNITLCNPHFSKSQI